MDVSNILTAHAAKYQSVTVEKGIPIQVDAGFLTVTDLNPIDEESYTANKEEYLQSTARDGVQTILAALFTLPTRTSPDGPLAQLPAPTTLLPRTKPLPKPKPPTKWERFAAAKGIQHKVRDKKIWDEEKQDWVNRWGRDGKNKEKEDQWITEVPLNAEINHDPVKIARDERKARVAKNERQQKQNTARAAGGGPKSTREERKADIDKTLASSRISTASMGKFDKKLEGEKKLRGIKRKFDPAEAVVEGEKAASLALLASMDSDARKIKRTRDPAAGEEDVLNVRKAVRFANKRGGGAAGASSSSGRGGGRGGKRGGKR